MCTAATFKNGDFYMGRTLDYERSYGDRITVTPRNYPFHFCALPDLTTHHAIIGMAAVMEGKIDGILLTGGLMRYDDILKGVEQRCGWIAPIAVYPGECEQEAMADAVLEVLRGQRKANRYTGVPVFRGFDWDKK